MQLSTTYYSIIVSFLFIGLLSSCERAAKDGGAQSASKDSLEIANADILENTVLTADQQTALTPEAILQTLKDGNADFVNDRLTIRNSSSRVRNAALGQFPKAVILSCLDSRVPVEDVFHRGIGDVFVARVAGNIENDDILGSMEFGTKVSGAKVILVLGHESCGAIKSAIDDVRLGNITALLSKIKPAVEKTDFDGERNSANPEYVHEVCTKNVQVTMENIRRKSPILNEMERDGQLRIAGGVYDMGTGKVSFL